jgi:tRNA modification GTPase
MRLLDQARDTAAEVAGNFEARYPYEIAAQSLHYLIETLGEITGEITPDDVLNAVFSRFCIGK